MTEEKKKFVENLIATIILVVMVAGFVGAIKAVWTIASRYQRLHETAVVSMQ